ncbi:hypothetical protein V2J09_016752 [Rumex salicifolius]
MEQSLVSKVQKFLSTISLPPASNETFLILFAKMAEPEFIEQFRRINLCNVYYKTITKALVNFLNPIFIPGRLISDNVILAQEVVHSMNKKQCKKSLIKRKLTTGSGGNISLIPLKILIYLFVLCLERLEHCIQNSVDAGLWKPLSLCRRGPKLSHLFFADNILLFAEASVSQLKVVQHCLDQFCGAFGQRINIAKSRIFVLKNEQLSRASGFPTTRNLGKYLGILIMYEKPKKEVFLPIISKMQLKTRWKARTLSMAGQVTLVRSILSTIPTYTMQTVFLPKSICEQIDRICEAFVWESIDSGKKLHLVAWSELCRPKYEGGMGLRMAQPTNMALISKIGWNLFSHPDKLWAQVLLAKYRARKNQILCLACL